MGFRFRKTISLLPGVRINMSKSGPSVSVGGKGSTVNFGKKGTKTTFGLPGTGMSYSSYKRYGEGEEGEGAHRPPNNASPRRAFSIVPVIIVGLVFYAIYQGGGLSHIVKSKVADATRALQTQASTPAPAAPQSPVAQADAHIFAVAPSSTTACGLPYPCQLQPILDSSDWSAVSQAFARAIMHDGDDRVEWTGQVPARHGYVKRGKRLASGNCTSYAVAAHVDGKTVIRRVKVCEQARGVPELK